MLPSPVQAVIADMLPRLKALAVGRYAVSIGGSIGRGNFDSLSDIDFRLFCESVSPEREYFQDELTADLKRWSEQGVTIDGCWIRRIDEVSAQLDEWCRGIIAREDRVWTIWGYHLLADIGSQYVIDDPYGIIAGWKAQVAQYPPLLKQALLDKHLASVRYWRDDYHYRNKVRRKDVVFLAGLSSKLVHDLIQILFALNETYYVGDGNNLAYVRRFAHVPGDFIAKAEAVLYPRPSEDMFEQQRETLIQMIDAVEGLVAAQG